VNSPLKPILPAAAADPVVWNGLFGSGRGLAILEAARQAGHPVLVVARNAQTLQTLEEEIRFYATGSDLPILNFPDWECLPYDSVSPHPDIVSARLACLHALPGLNRGIVLTQATTLLYRMAPVEHVLAHSLMLDTGGTLDLERFREQLVLAAYQAVSQVMEPGEFAVRGGIIDLFPMGTESPYRIDLLDDRIESIREFDPASQRSGRRLDRVRLLPAREFPVTEAAIQRFRQAFRTRFEGDPQKASVYRDISQGLAPAGIEFYLPLFFEQPASFFDYLPADAVFMLDDRLADSVESFARETAERYKILRHDRERPVLPPGELFIDAADLLARMKTRPRVTIPDLRADSGITGMRVIDYACPPPGAYPAETHGQAPYRQLMNRLGQSDARTLLVAESPGRRETLRGLLREHGFEATDVASWGQFLRGDMALGLTSAELAKGLRLPDAGIEVITEPQLHGERASQRRRRSTSLARDPAAILKSLAELRIGDPVVHEEHGVGRYRGLQTLDAGDGPSEFLTIEYADGDKLYVPVLSLHLVSRYTGTDPEHAPLHKLGGEAWEKAKGQALQKAHDAAVELLEVQALRAARQGFAYPPRDDRYEAFAEAFPFEETPDQAKAIDEVLADMESARPMDRLVCGDVGFGKTEVAMRAAFLAVQNGRQVAVLVPTTLLASQHYETFRDRFAPVHTKTGGSKPVRIELLSRFRSKREETLALEGLASGDVAIVIGTHRLLQPDVQFHDLGLVVLDEEHRFGVRQKERLKQLRAEVDVLTLTATPIPRTLNLSLSGMREISIIAQAPEGRLAIKTLIGERSEGLVREACLREIRRGGQVYFLHNEVRTIERTAEQLQKLVPEAQVHVAHGQMPERELEHIMLDFYHRRFNILVCSTIIESGIDVPSANTILIERADKLGLAQLHQLRGRVGRSHHRAYAYLLIPGWNAISGDARKRLEAIGSLEDLGAGFVLASHDLEIRGAGELLGEAQSGAIDEVGFSLYAELLERTIRALREGRLPGQEAAASRRLEVNLHAPALFPEDYLPDVHLRLVLYKRVATAGSLEALNALQEEIVDRFGRLPPEGRLLFAATALKLRAGPLGIRRIEAGPKGARIDFVEKPDVDPGTILRLMQAAPRLYRLDGPNRIRITAELPDADARLKALGQFIDGLGAR